METKLANKQDDLNSFFNAVDHWNESMELSRDKYTYDKLRDTDDNTLQSQLEVTKKQVRAWRSVENLMVTLDTKQQKNVIILMQSLVVLKSLVDVYNETRYEPALTQAQILIKEIKKIDRNYNVFLNIQTEIVRNISGSKQKKIRVMLRSVRGNLSSAREIGFASQAIVKMLNLITSSDILNIKDILDAKNRASFLELINTHEKSKDGGSDEVIRQVGACVFKTSQGSLKLSKTVKNIVKVFKGEANLSKKSSVKVAQELKNISSDSSLSVTEKIRQQRGVLDNAYTVLEEKIADEDISEEEAENKRDSLRVLRAMAEAEVLIQPSESNEIAMEMGLTQEQEKAMLSTGRTIISAGAGSGKTRVLSAKVANLLREDNDVSPYNIIAVSFSRKSAKDLQEKIKSSVGEKIPNIETTALGRTTHSLAIEFINRFDPEASKTIVADQFQSETILKKAIKLSKNTSSGNEKPKTEGFFDSKVDALGGKNFQNDLRILNLLTSSQRWLEGKGFSGKGLTTKLQGISSEYLKFKSLTEDDASFVNELLGTNRGKRVLEKAFGGKYQKIKKYTFPSYKQKKEASNKVEWWGVKDLVNAKTKVPSMKACKLFITKAKSQMLTPSLAFNKVDGSGDEYVIKAKIYGCYQHLMGQENLMDFDDVLIKGVQVLNTAGNLKQVQDQYKHIIVDEAQDLNPVQHTFFGLIAGTHTSGNKGQAPKEVDADDQDFEGKSFTLVGDENQSIYGFRGATQKEFSSKADKNQGSFGLMSIGVNFRSGNNIVAAANKLANTEADGSLGLSCVASFKDQKDTIKHDKHEDVGKAAKNVADHIKTMTESEFSDGNPSDFGIACRTNAEIIPYALALLEKGVPFKSGVNPFTHKSTKAIIRILGLLTENTSLQMSALYNFHKDLKFDIPNIEGLIETAKSITGQSSYKKIAEAINNSMAHIAEPEEDDVYDERLTEYILENYQDSDELNDIYDYFDMMVGFMIKGVENPADAFDIALGYKPYEEDEGDYNYVQSPDGKKLHEILGESLTKKDQAILESYAPSDDDDDDDEVLNQAVELGTGKDQAELSEKEQKEYALAPLPALRQLFLNATQDKEGFEQIFAKIKKMKDDADGQSMMKDDSDVVVLDTVHGWKGLEVKNLYVPMVEGTFPSKRSTFDPLVHADQKEADAERDEQERKLAYVAVTRGMSSVTVLSYKNGTTGEELGDSQYINELGLCVSNDKSASQKRLAAALDILSEYAQVEDDDMTDAEFEEATEGL